MVAPSSRIASANGKPGGASKLPGASSIPGATRASSAQLPTTAASSSSGAALVPPRRAPSPSQAAFGSGVSRIPAAGGLAAPSAGGSRLPGPSSAGSRFGFGAGASAGAAASSVKRPFSAVGSSTDAAGPSKRLASALNAAQPRSSAIPARPSSRASVASSTGSGPALDITTTPIQPVHPHVPEVPDHLLSGPPSESAEYMLSVMKNEYERRTLVQKQEYTALEKQLAAKIRELSKVEKKMGDVLDEWERVREEKEEKEQEALAEKEKLSTELEEVRKNYTGLLEEHEALQSTHASSSTQADAELSSLRLAKAQWEAERVRLEEEAKLAREAQARTEEEREALEKVLEEEGERARGLEERARASATGWGSREEAEAVEKEIKRQAIHIQGLESTIEKLRQENKFHTDTATNIELLREEKRSLESKLRGMEDLRSSLVAAEARATALTEENTAWKNAVEGVLRSGPNATRVAELLETQEVIALPALAASSDAQESLTPSTAQAQLSNVLNVLAALHTRASIQASSLADLRVRLTELEESGAQHAQERDARGRELAEVKASLVRAERAEQRWKAEVGRYREMLDSYEAERIKFQSGSGAPDQGQEEGAETADETKGGDEAAAVAEGDATTEDGPPPVKVEVTKEHARASIGPSSEASLARIASLEGLVDELRTQCETVSVELETARREVARLEEALSLASVDAGAAAKVKELNKALEVSKAEYEQLFKDAEALSKENDKLLERVGRGEFDTTKEKCWTLNKTPASEHFAVRTAQLEALKKENEDLLKRLDEVNTVAAAQPATATDAATAESAAGAGALVPRQVVENFKKDIQDLNKSIQAKDKAMLRLKQVFNKKATEFREVVQSLFGYKIRFLENGKVKLSSVYALSSKGRGTNIIFQSNPNNTAQMQLLLGDGDVEGAGGLKDLQWLKEYWLGEERHNVPCFLAALSKELYEAVTRVEKRSAWRMEIGEDEEEEGRPAQRDGDGDAVMQA